jgi:hypothetical protein
MRTLPGKITLTEFILEAANRLSNPNPQLKTLLHTALETSDPRSWREVLNHVLCCKNASDAALEDEYWVPSYIPGFDVSNLGRVRSHVWWRSGKTRPDRSYLPKLRHPTRNKDGHLCLGVHVEGVHSSHFVHTLVCTAFHGPRPDPELVCRHLDGNPENNKPGNLAWGTSEENVADAIRHGRRRSGAASSCAALTEGDVAYILSSSATGTALSEELGVSQATVSRVRSGVRYG